MQTPVMMVHGMCCTGQVWAQFRSFFEARGARVYTPTLRPEQRVNVRHKPPRSLSELSLDDYVADLEREVERIVSETGLTPAVIGHSMGGLLAQKLAERQRVAAAVFLSPALPAGVATMQTRLVWGAIMLGDALGFGAPVIRPQRRLLDRVVLNAVPDGERDEILDRMCFESGRVFRQFRHYPVDETKVRVPVLTVAASRDRLIPAAAVRLAGRKYAAVGGEFREYREHGHWMYAEPGWEKPAADVFGWLERVTERSDLAQAAQ